MNRRGNPLLIGLFVVVGLALVAVGILVGTGGNLFKPRERAVMYFQESVYGLQVGAPVVFRGVRLGSVSSVGLEYESHTSQFTIPVEVEFERVAAATVDATGSRSAPSVSLDDLVKRGLTAQLAIQSLLTGQLYVDLDLRRGKPGTLRRPLQTTGPVEIPTTPTTIQNVKAQVEAIDWRQVVDDIGGTARALRDLMSKPAIGRTLDNLEQVSSQLQKLLTGLESRLGPLSKDLQSTLTDARQTLQRFNNTADTVGGSARSVGRTADRFGALADPNAPLIQSLQRSADELARAASGLRQNLGSDAPLPKQLDQTLNEMTRAARSVRELADQLERHPDALLRGAPRVESKP